MKSLILVGATVLWLGSGNQFRAEANHACEVRRRNLGDRKVVKKLCTFLELDFQPQMVKGGGFKPPAYTSRQHVLVGKAPEK